MNKHTRAILGTLAIVLALASAIIMAIWRVNPPMADEMNPSFQRMMHNLQRLATAERWVGTPQVAAARDEIVAEIEAMGLEPIVHRSIITLEDRYEAGELINYLIRSEWMQAPFSETWEENILNWIAQRHPEHPLITQGFMYVDNIWVTLQSPNPSAGNIMFVAHYDTWPNKPGAADAMMPTVGMLEALRTHAHNDNLANNMHFLFTDGEEWLALGALAFSRDFPEMIDDVDMLLNLEAIGNSGGVLAFEFSEAPYNMVRLFNRAVPRPISFHWAQWVYYEFMGGTYTDFTVFKHYGFPGLNFAVIGGNEHYHTPTDTYENINRNTAYHYMLMIMAMADYAAQNSIYGVGTPSHNAIFFTFLPGMNMIVMTAATANILTGLAFAIAIAFLVYNFKVKLPKSRFITAFLILMMVATILLLIFLSHLSYLLWMPLLFAATFAFLKRCTLLYRCAMTVCGMITLLLWVPPLYLLFQIF